MAFSIGVNAVNFHPVDENPKGILLTTHEESFLTTILMQKIKGRQENRRVQISLKDMK